MGMRPTFSLKGMMMVVQQQHVRYEAKDEPKSGLQDTFESWSHKN
jgi:hypothetical protein